MMPSVKLLSIVSPASSCLLCGWDGQVAQRAATVLGRDDPTAREIVLDVLSVLAFAVGGLPPAILRAVERSLRSTYLSVRKCGYWGLFYSWRSSCSHPVAQRSMFSGYQARVLCLPRATRSEAWTEAC